MLYIYHGSLQMLIINGLKNIGSALKGTTKKNRKYDGL